MAVDGYTILAMAVAHHWLFGWPLVTLERAGTFGSTAGCGLHQHGLLRVESAPVFGGFTWRKQQRPGIVGGVNVLVDTAISSYIHTSPGVEALVNEDSETRCWCVSDDTPPPALTSC